MKIRQLTLAEAEFVAHRLATELMSSDDEPIPPFHTREAGKLESCLKEPFQTFGGRNLHHTFADKAATLFYLITKNHCFENGNKRMAVTLTMVFCFINKRWINMSSEEMYRIANLVARSHSKDRDKVHIILQTLFKGLLEPMPKEHRLDRRRLGNPQ